MAIDPVTMASLASSLGSLFGGGGSGGMMGNIGAALFGGGNRAVKRMGAGYDDARRTVMPMLQDNIARFNPYSQVGTQATGLISSLLGMGGTPGQANYSGYLANNPDVAASYASTIKQPHFVKGAGRAADRDGSGDISPEEYAQYHYEQFGKTEGRELPTSGGTSDTSGAEALSRFRESTGYQDQLSAALGGTTANAAARGLLGSSGTGKTFQNNAAQIAQGSFGNFLNNLMGQQGVGLQATGSQAELGQNMANFLGQNILGKAGVMSQKTGGGFLGQLFKASQPPPEDRPK
jgi:hypothetical protein